MITLHLDCIPALDSEPPAAAAVQENKFGAFISLHQLRVGRDMGGRGGLVVTCDMFHCYPFCE